MAEGAVALAAIGLVGSILAFVVKPLFRLLDENTVAQKEGNKVQLQLVQSHQEVANAIKQGNKEAKDRNGHLADLVIESKNQVVELADRNLKAYQEVEHQYVHQQDIDTQTIKRGK